MEKRLWAVIWTFLLACTSNPKPFDPEHPADAWAADCYPQNVEGLGRWVFLRCTFTNRSSQALLFPPTHLLSSEQDLWRQPEASELKQLKHDLQTRKSAAALPPFLGMNGSSSPESFIGQALVLSGVWILRFNNKTENPKMIDKDIKVEAGQDFEQVFALRRESPDVPRFITLGDASGLFKKSIPIANDPRQRSTP